MVDDYVAGSVVFIAGLTNAAHVNHQFFLAQRKYAIALGRLDELEIRRKYTGHVSMALKAILRHTRKDALHFILVVDRFGKDILVRRIPRRAMDEHEFVLMMKFWQLAKVIPAFVHRCQLPGVQAITSPIDGSQSNGVKAFGVEKCRLIVVAHYSEGRFLHDQIQTFARVWSVADDIAQAHDFIDVLASNIRQDSLECFQIAVNIAYQCLPHYGLLNGTACNPAPRRGGFW